MIDADAISAALFDLNLEEIKALEALALQSSEGAFLEYENRQNQDKSTAE